MNVSTMRKSDRDEIVSTVVSALIDDPVERWLFPDPEQYSRTPGVPVARAGAWPPITLMIRASR
jgi:hypothetical protein